MTLSNTLDNALSPLLPFLITAIGLASCGYILVLDSNRHQEILKTRQSEWVDQCALTPVAALGKVKKVRENGAWLYFTSGIVQFYAFDDLKKAQCSR
jgi:hypothetical protein